MRPLIAIKILLLAGASTWCLLLQSCTHSNAIRVVPDLQTNGETMRQGFVWLPSYGKSTRTDPELKRRVDQIVDESLAKYPDGLWMKKASVGHYRLVSNGPMLKIPGIWAMCGNSYMGGFDQGEARELTVKLFEAYGIALETPSFIDGEGFTFLADGYNPDLKVGFELRNKHPLPFFLEKPKSREPVSNESLEDRELRPLEEAMYADQFSLFVCDSYINYDNDHKMSLSFYLASLIDYLDWLHGYPYTDFDRVLGEQKEVVGASRYPWHLSDVWGFEDVFQESPWTVQRTEGGEQSIGVGESIRLLPGETAFYETPEGVSSGLLDRNGWAQAVVWFTVTEPENISIDVDFELNEDTDTRARWSVLPGRDGVLICRLRPDEAVSHHNLRSLSIRNTNGFPIAITPWKIGANAS